jgi:hypothetical protein
MEIFVAKLGLQQKKPLIGVLKGLCSAQNPYSYRSILPAVFNFMLSK